METAGEGPCSRCGGRHRPDASGGLCPARLMQIGLEVPERIGDYDIIGELGRGGMGVIYRATPRPVGPVVALKVIQAGEQATPEERRRFLAEIEAVSALKHPHIVPIHHVGEHEGLPYYTMPLYAGSLAGNMARFRAPRAAARFLATVARAVHHAHERGVLHRDLKPANILLDEEDRPYVSDFGIAKRIVELDPTSQPEPLPRTEQSTIAGTLMYMAPEQARGDRHVTTATDLYSLGVVMYELLTGRSPLEGDSPSTVHAKRERGIDPVRPSSIVPELSRDLEAICLKCLEGEPARRYGSAGELAADLERFLAGEPVEARPAGRSERAWRFVRRHWVTVGAGGGTILLLGVAVAISTWFANAQALELQRDALRTNAFAARTIALAVALHLREQINAVVAAAADPEVVQLLRGAGTVDVIERRRTGLLFSSLSLLNRSGTGVARAPLSPPAYIGSDYSWRDYFRGSRRLGLEGLRTGYVARAFRSEADNNYKFAVSTPVYEGNTWVGVLMAATNTNSTLGRVRLDDEDDVRRKVVLVAPRDKRRGEREVSGEYVVILHDGIDHGTEIAISSPRLRELGVIHTAHYSPRWVHAEPITDDDHRDPVPGFEGRWLAGFAPVDGTGYVVIVQTRYDAAIEPNARLWRRLTYVGIALLAWFSLLGALWAIRRGRHRRLATLSR